MRLGAVFGDERPKGIIWGWCSCRGGRTAYCRLGREGNVRLVLKSLTFVERMSVSRQMASLIEGCVQITATKLR